MQLKSDRVWVFGEFKRQVIKQFGDVDLGVRSIRGTGGISLRVTKILPNFYSNSNAGTEPVEKNPIFILVPEVSLDYVHPDKSCETVRFGTAERHAGHVGLVRAIGLFKGTAMLYVCLDPLEEADVQALEIGSLGM